MHNPEPEPEPKPGLDLDTGLQSRRTIASVLMTNPMYRPPPIFNDRLRRSAGFIISTHTQGEYWLLDLAECVKKKKTLKSYQRQEKGPRIGEMECWVLVRYLQRDARSECSVVSPNVV